MKFLCEDSLPALCSCASVSVGVPEGDLLMWSLRFNVSCVVRGEGAGREQEQATCDIISNNFTCGQLS
jgi:hypothetical protein